MENDVISFIYNACFLTYQLQYTMYTGQNNIYYNSINSL